MLGSPRCCCLLSHRARVRMNSQQSNTRKKSEFSCMLRQIVREGNRFGAYVAPNEASLAG